MAISNHERVGKAMELLRDGLLPFVERELTAQHGNYGITAVTANWRNEPTFRLHHVANHDWPLGGLAFHTHRAQLPVLSGAWPKVYARPACAEPALLGAGCTSFRRRPHHTAAGDHT